MTYKCVRKFYIDVFDEYGFNTEKSMIVPEDSIWEENTECSREYGDVHLDRIWKSKKAKTRPWIEITKERFEEYFEPYQKGGKE